MRKLLLAVFFLPLLFSCNNVGVNNGTSTIDSAYVGQLTDSSSEAIRFLDPLVEKYPNYKDNSIAQESVYDELNKYFTSCEGKPFPFINGMTLVFNKIKSVNGDKAVVLFITDPYAHYSQKWDVAFSVEFEISKEEAGKLNTHDWFTLKGTLKKWNKFGTPYSFEIGSCFYLGTFVMDNVELEKTFSSDV